MAQAVLFIDGERIRQRGLHAPKRNTGVTSWAKDILKLFAEDLIAANPDYKYLRADRLTAANVNAEEIRLLWQVKDIAVGVVIDRTANAMCT